ncbi:MAG: hypothetical protein GTN83_17210, partial [Acidobacteria bacterium]|nr:hypothetical protein [Acidobacteriota bacterium]
MNFGQIQATPGSLMTGTIVDESGSGVAANLALFLRLNGALSSVTNSDSCSGNFSVGLPPNLGTDEYRMDLRDIAGKGLQSSQVRWITPNGD